MKKILCFFFVIANLSCSQRTPAIIVPFDPSHKNAVMDIVFQDPLSFFTGSAVISRGMMTVEHFAAENKKGMEALLQDQLRMKKVLVVGQKVAGFVEFFRAKELSLETLKKQLKLQGVPVPDDAQLAVSVPWLKKTDAECVFFAEIESLAVDRGFRRMGYGRALLRDAITDIKKRWPAIKNVKLNVNASNASARKLYESEAFVPCAYQSLAVVDIVQYEKELK